MTPEEQKAIDDAENSHSKSSGGTSALGAGAAGALSGGTFGLTGNIGPLADYSTRAQQEHPGAYGIGYGAGTIAGAVGAPGLLLGKAVSKIAPQATTLAGGGMAGVPTKAAAGVQAAKDMFSPITSKLAEYAKPLADKMPSWIKAVPDMAPTTTKQILPRVVTPLTGPEPQPLPAGSYGEAETDTKPFSALASFLRQAGDNNNPAIQQAATDAEQLIDPKDPDSKRKVAMALQGTPQGRAVGNSDSNLRTET